MKWSHLTGTDNMKIYTRIFAGLRFPAPLLLFGAVFPLHGQTPLPTADSLVRRGNLALSRESLDSALDDFKEALDLDRTSIPALLGAGKTLALSEQWADAAGYFDDALSADSTNITAHYYFAVSRRETGKAKAWLLRDADWRSSMKNFEWVMRHDSLFEDVLYQYALLLNCQKNYTGAIAAGIAQVQKRPRVDKTRLGLYKLYRSFVVSDNAAATEWLSTQRDPIALYFLAEAYRRANKIEEAEVILDSLTRVFGYTFVTPSYLSLARCAVKRDRPDLIEKYFWDAVESIRKPIDADYIFEDIKYLVTDAELQFYMALDQPEQKTDFMRGFWTARNPAPGMDTNPRISEHYRRLVIAEERYEYYGFRTQFMNPDRLNQLQFPKSFYLNAEFSDMGEIFVRHGPPDGILRADPVDGDPNQSWLYESRGDAPRMIFHFIRRNTIENNWRLAPIPENRALLSDLATWDPEYLDLLKGDATQGNVAERVLNESRVAVTTALTTDAHTQPEGTKPFDVPHSIDTFRGKGTKALVDISYALPLSLIHTGLQEEAQTLSVVVGLAFHSLQRETGFSKLDTIRFAANRSMEGAYIGLYRFYLPADKYTFSMQVRPLGTHFVGNWNSAAEIPDYSRPDFALSDLEFLVPSSEKTAIEIEGIKVSPSPFRVFLRNQPLYLYLRLYNLVKDADGNTRYTAKYFLSPSGAGSERAEAAVDQVPDKPGTLALASGERNGNEETGAEFRKIDLKDVDPGVYKIRAVVTDRKRVQTIIRSRIIEVRNP